MQKPLVYRLSRLLKVVGTDTDRWATSDFLSVIHSNYMADLVSLTISVDNRKLFYPRVFTSPLRGLPLDYFKAGWSQKLEWCPYQTYENFDDICMRIWTQHRNVPDRQADRNGISIARAACLCTLVRDEN